MIRILINFDLADTNHLHMFNTKTKQSHTKTLAALMFHYHEHSPKYTGA